MRTSDTAAVPPLESRPQPPPPFGSVIERTIDVFALAGAPYEPRAEVAAASKIWWQCGITLRITSLKFFDEKETRRLLAVTAEDASKPLQDLMIDVSVDEETPSMQRLRALWRAHRRGDHAVFFAAKVRLRTNAAPAAADPRQPIVYIGPYDAWPGWVLAHELGHHWIASGHRGLESSLMHPSSPGNTVSELECLAARGVESARLKVLRNQE